jgi:hypothetical protein
MKSNLVYSNASGGGATSITAKNAHRQGAAYESKLEIYAEIQAGAVFKTPGFFILIFHRRARRGRREKYKIESQISRIRIHILILAPSLRSPRSLR